MSIARHCSVFRRGAAAFLPHAAAVLLLLLLLPLPPPEGKVCK